MVLELPTPCENLIEFLDRHKGNIEENVAMAIMKQATLAAQTCCQRGVLHRDVKLENLLINPVTLNPEKRLELDNVDLHDWFKYLICQTEYNEIIDVGFSSYEIGRKLGEGGFGSVYAGVRLKDGLEVALKFADKVGIEWINIEGHPEPVPKEIGLLILANKGPWVPQIIQLLDWVEEAERYIMVQELPTPCENLFEFLDRHEGTLEENVVKAIMKQATLAAQPCCQRGVLHRDVKLENLLINPDTLEVKLIE
ncbi:unnamed protein product [Leuciscus chuanchicus]